MNYARVTYNQSVAGNKNFSVPFQYLSRDHIKVTVDGAEVPFTWLNPNTVSLNTAPAMGAEVDIRRSTSPGDLLVQFTDGSVISENDLGLLSKQSFYLVQESSDLANESNTLANDAVESAEEATATATKASQDAATAVSTANSATATANTALSNANQAVQTANTALGTANTASTAATNAVTTANSAKTSANTAVSTANAATAKADSATTKADAAVTTANKAAQDASKALTTANTALADAGTAVSLANFASLQADSAQAAARQAADAASSAASDANTAVQTATSLETTVTQVLENVQAIANGDLTDFAKNSENLSKLTDPAMARENIGLGRVNNTSDQDKPISTATQAALNGKADTAHNHAVADVTGLQAALDGKAAASHTHPISNVTGLQTALDGKAAVNHTHTIDNVSGLQAALDGKAASSHTHLWAHITDKPTTFPPTGHAHAVGDVTGLQGALDGKVSKAGDTMTGNLTIQNTAPTIAMVDTDGVRRSLHVDAGLMGFLSSSGAWEMYTNNSGQLWTSSYGWLHTKFFNGVTNCASSVDHRYAINCYGSGNRVAYIDYELINNGGSVQLRAVKGLANCNCNCNCSC